MINLDLVLDVIFFDKYTCPVWDIVGDCGRQDRILEKYE